MSRDFYELCYDQYKQEMSESDRIYQRVGVMLVAIPLLGAVTVKLGRIDMLESCFKRVDIFFYYFASLTTIIALAVGVVFLFLCAYPRQYKTLANMDVWYKWREDYKKYLKDKEKGDKSEANSELDLALFENICPRLVEAQPINAEINEKRRKAFQGSIKAMVIAVVAVGFQSLFHLIIIIQGI